MQQPEADEITEQLAMAFLELIHERRLRGKPHLAATLETTAQWIAERTALEVRPRHIQVLAKAMAEAGLIEIGGGGIGRPNTYASREDSMGPEQFWTQVDAFLMVWAHPSRRALAAGHRQDR